MKRARGSPRTLLDLELALQLAKALLCLAVCDMTAKRRVVALELKAIRVVLAVLHRCVGVRAFGAAQLDNDAIALL